MKVKIDIDTRTFIRFGLVVIGFVVAALAIYSARTALLILGTSLFLALALNSPVAAIAKRLPGKSRTGATAISYLAVVAVLVAVITFVVPPVVDQTVKFAETIPTLADEFTNQWKVVDELVDKYNLRSQVDTAIANAKTAITSWATNIGKGVLSSISSIFSFLVTAFLVFVLTFLMLIEGPSWKKYWFSIYQDKAKMQRHQKILTQMYNVVTGYVTGQLLVSAIGAAFSALAVFILSLIFSQVPANLAVITLAATFVLTLIPMFGATIAGILMSLLIAFNSVPAAIIFAVFFIVYQQIENNFISPHIQSKKINLSALVVLAAVTIGIYTFGLIGGIISIPIAGCVRVLIEDYLARAKITRQQNSKPLAKLINKLQTKQ